MNTCWVAVDAKGDFLCSIDTDKNGVKLNQELTKAWKMKQGKEKKGQAHRFEVGEDRIADFSQQGHLVLLHKGKNTNLKPLIYDRALQSFR